MAAARSNSLGWTAELRMEEWVHVQMGGAPRAHDAVQRWVQGVQQEIAGRVVLRGCPWEEGGRRRRGAAQMMWGLNSAETTHKNCESCIAIHFAVVNRYMILSFGTF